MLHSGSFGVYTRKPTYVELSLHHRPCDSLSVQLSTNVDGQDSFKR